jgi:hypothetical protein
MLNVAIRTVPGEEAANEAGLLILLAEPLFEFGNSAINVRKSFGITHHHRNLKVGR